MQEPLFESSEPLPKDDSPQPLEPSPSNEIEIVKPGRMDCGLPQPGWKLAIAIVVGIWLIHGITMLLGLLMTDPSAFGNPQAGSSLIERLTSGQLVQLLAFDQGVFVLVAFLGTWWVFGKRFGRVIPMQWPPMRHVALICLLVLPLAVMDGFLAQKVIEISETLFGVTPSQDLPELLGGITEEPALTLLLILAVAPAFGEELIFRGVIGRGLVGRYGIFAGILGTSVLFSIVHGNWPQGVGVFFVGVMCHVAYLSTRTLAAPILLHFLNNTLPVLALKSLASQNAEGAMNAADQMTTDISPWIVLAAAVCVAVLGCLLWKTRVQFRDIDGHVMEEFPSGVEAPEGAAIVEHRPVPLFWFPLAGVSYLLFLVSTSLNTPAM